VHQFGEVQKEFSVNFEFLQNRSRGNVPLIKRSISARGIRNPGKTDLPNWVLVSLHQIGGA
jgi:hypothetical protein